LQNAKGTGDLYLTLSDINAPSMIGTHHEAQSGTRDNDLIDLLQTRWKGQNHTMKIRWPYILCLATILLLSSCARPTVVLDRVFVRNATDDKITDVKIHHEPSAWVGSVNAILPQKSYDIGFSGQPLLTRQASVSWRDGDDRPWSLAIELPDKPADAERPSMSLVYIIYPSGRVDVHLLESVKIK